MNADAAATLLYDEAAHLDARRWDDWLALYWPDAQFWVPAWRDDETLVSDPHTEVSLIYCTARAGLEDRVWRVRSGLSVASARMPRTLHMLTNVVVRSDADAAAVQACWSCHHWHPHDRTQSLLFGRYEYRLTCRDGRWAIAAKKVLLLNDRIPTMIDFYCL